MRLSRQDATLAIRSFARHRGFTITAVVSLALAIALNTTMYSVLDALVNPPTDARDPDRLVTVQLYGDAHNRVDPAAKAEMFREASSLFAGTTYSRSQFGGWMGIEFGSRFAQATPVVVQPNYFDVLGVTPLRGRAFVTGDVYAETQPVMINERLARVLSPDREFPVGQSILLDGTAHPVIGVVKRGPDLVMPLPPTTDLAALQPTLVRLRDGIDFAQAESQVKLMSARIAELAREDPKATGYLLKPAYGSQFHLAYFHYALGGAVIAVLLIACANLANLQLARGLGRSRELALRSALGASRRDIITQLLLESAILAAAGLVAGLLLTFWGMHLIEARIPKAVAQYVVAPEISWRLLAFAAAATLLCTVLIGLFPAIRVSRVDPNDLLKSGAGTGANRRNRRQYGIMVAAEIGLSLALLSAAAIVVRTALRVREVSIGYDPKPLTAATIILRPARDTVIETTALANALLTRFRSIPDAADAAISEQGGVARKAITVDEAAGPPRQLDAPGLSYQIVTPAYFRVYGLPIVKGRDFLDGPASEPEVIVDPEMATRLWPGVDPIGRHVKLGSYDSDRPWARVVGVVGSPPDRAEEIRTRDVATQRRERFGRLYLLRSGEQSLPLGAGRALWISAVIRAKTDPRRMPVTVGRYFPRSGLIYSARAASMEETLYLVQTRRSHDFVASLFALFATLALALAALGVYGIVTHTVHERTRELGVRLALGAGARDIIHAVVREGNPMVLSGVAIGLLLIRQTVAWLHAFSIEGDEYDAVLFATMAAVLFAVAAVSALVPAWRATRIDPVESLRSE